MQPVALELIMLRSVAPDLILRPGAQLAARVAERQGRFGVITLAGSPLLAELPEHLREGDRLRLRVEEITSERVIMKLVEQPLTHAEAPPLPAVPLPDGRTAHVRVDDDAGPLGDPDSEEGFVSLTWESPSLGAMHFTIGLGRGTVSASVSVAPGEPLAAAERAAGALQEALARRTGRTAQVQVGVRHDPVDFYV